MQFIRSTELRTSGSRLLNALQNTLAAGKRTLWLVPGGSNIPLVIDIMSKISDGQSRNLTVTLTDERYGSVGHADSNAAQLLAADLDTKAATFEQVLQAGLTLEETTKHFAQLAEKLFDAADIVIGQFGMGNDGHIAGILPGSVAISSPQWAASYQGPDFQRITLTPLALSEIDQAFVFAFGGNKRQALEQLHNEAVAIAEQPAQLLNHLPEAYVINDQIGEEES